MEMQKLISDVLEGITCIIPFDNVAFGPDKDATAGFLSVLNFTRLAFAIGGNTVALPKTLQLLCSKTVDNVFAICRECPSGVRLEIEDVYRIPLFEVSLKLVSTDYDSPNPDRIARLLENLCSFRSSAALVITRYPDVVTCLRLQTSSQDLFVLFNPRVISEHERVASLTFSKSPAQIAQRLCDVFPLDKIHTARKSLDWQARLLEKCALHSFVPRVTSSSAHVGEESLVMSSLTLLTLKAEVERLISRNGGLKTDKQRLENSVVELGAQLEEEKIKTRRAQSSKPSVPKSAPNTSHLHDRGPQLAQSFHSTGQHEHSSDSEDEMDPNVEFALQLQANFDSENNFLIEQKNELMRTTQRQYHCGICLDDFPEDDAVRIDACGHEVCRDCARGHVTNRIEEHRFPVLCPVCMTDHKNQNPGTIPGPLVQLLGVSEEQWKTWVEMEMAQFSVPFNCRKCHLSGFIDRQDLEAQPEIHCPFPKCNHVWCKTCQQTIEPGGPKHSCDGTSELDHLIKQQGWRYCPNCKTPIQKLDGCNHLSCIAPGCNTHFCYRCGKTINRTAIPREIAEGKSAHFRTCSIF